MAPPDREPPEVTATGGDPERWGRATWVALLLLAAIAAPLLLTGLEGEGLRIHDEGLYGQLARNALHHGRYVHAVAADGSPYPAFPKPPLTIAAVAASFHVFGISITALRLPFALSMLGLVLVCFAWGRRIAGLSLAIAWAGSMLVCAAAFRWGRVACIEPMMMLWIVAALWAYHEAMLRDGRRAVGWALACGVALALAFATKQVVVAVAILPIFGLETIRWRWRQAWPRLLLAMALPAGAAIGWGWAVYRALGSAAIDLYVRTGVLDRVEGYQTGSLSRSLNELSEVLAQASDPFVWGLGVVGIVLLVLDRPRSRRDADGAWLLPLLLLTVVLVFENLSSSMLPWYAFDLIPPLMGGMGFVIAGLVTPVDDRMGLVRATAGALALGVGAVGALAGWVSQIDAAVALGVAVVVLWRLPDTAARWGRQLLIGLAAVILVATAADQPALRMLPEGHAQLMRTFAARGITTVAVGSDTGLPGEHAWATYYGPGARWVKRTPWRSHDTVEAYVTGTIWPQEVVARPGVELLRVPGATAFVGELRTSPLPGLSLDEMLDAGPLSFEAEHMVSQREGTLWADDDAVGGMARAVVPTRGRTREAFVLSHGVRARLPRGTYTAGFVLRSDCGTIVDRPAAVVKVIAGSKVRGTGQLSCTASGTGRYETLEVEFSLSRAADVDLHVQYFRGKLWHDRTWIRRR